VTREEAGHRFVRKERVKLHRMPRVVWHRCERCGRAAFELHPDTHLVDELVPCTGSRA
jgi:hypothetical protein